MGEKREKDVGPAPKHTDAPLESRPRWNPENEVSPSWPTAIDSLQRWQTVSLARLITLSSTEIAVQIVQSKLFLLDLKITAKILSHQRPRLRC